MTVLQITIVIGIGLVDGTIRSAELLTGTLPRL
jgi:hypothetical protein